MHKISYSPSNLSNSKSPIQMLLRRINRLRFRHRAWAERIQLVIASASLFALAELHCLTARPMPHSSPLVVKLYAVQAATSAL